MSKLFGLFTLATLATNPFFTVGHNSEHLLQNYNNVIAVLKKEKINTGMQSSKIE